MKRDNIQLAEECFKSAQITGDLSDSSILKYRDSVKRFFAVAAGKSFADLEICDFDDFILTARKAGASNSRIANVISAMKWVISSLQASGKISGRLDLEKIRKPKIGRREVNYLTEHEIKIFIDCIQKDIEKGIAVRKIRLMALVIFLLQTGARIGEALSINIENINKQNMEIAIIGKGGKPRPLFLTRETLKWIDQYLLLRKSDHPALFLALNEKARWKQTDVGRSFRRYVKISGIRKKFTLHTLRHTFATQSIFRKVPINTIQYLLGHSNLETTMKYYIGAVEKEMAKSFIKDEYFDFIPKAELKILS